MLRANYAKGKKSVLTRNGFRMAESLPKCYFSRVEILFKSQNGKRNNQKLPSRQRNIRISNDVSTEVYRATFASWKSVV